MQNDRCQSNNMRIGNQGEELERGLFLLLRDTYFPPHYHSIRE